MIISASFMNTLLNWKHRKSRLVLADGSELEPMCSVSAGDPAKESQANER